MSQRVYVNNFKTTLSADIVASDTTIPVTNIAVVTAQLSTLTNGQFFLVTLDDGVKYEIIKVRAISGSSLASVIRGQENTSAAQFSQGTRVEARVTAGTLSDFARLTDRVADLASVDLLLSETQTDANSVLTQSLDDAGNPIMALKSSGYGAWRFPSHPTKARSAAVVGSGPSTTSVNVTSTSFILSSALPGGYIIQFLTGVNSGLCRLITSSTSTSLTWATPFAVPPAPGDTFDVYQSVSTSLGTISTLQDDSIAIALIFAD